MMTRFNFWKRRDELILVRAQSEQFPVSSKLGYLSYFEIFDWLRFGWLFRLHEFFVEFSRY